MVVAGGVLAADYRDEAQTARHDHRRLLRHDHRPVSHLRFPTRPDAACCRRPIRGSPIGWEWRSRRSFATRASACCLQTKDDFRFIIPYVEFAKEVKGLKPYVLDTSVVIDGRIADIVETRVIDNQLIMPQFVIAELQAIADSNDKLKRNRGRRGLDILNRLRSDPKVDLMIYDRDLPEFAGQPVDQQLVLLAKHLEGKVVTNDYNLNKVAKLHNVGVINLNDIANSLKPVFLPGEEIEVRIVKAGEEAGQGVGYLEDGTMVVIEGGRDHISQQVMAVVTSVLQTSAGRMVFGRYTRAVSGSDGPTRQAPEAAMTK